jgi:hypothetical protein
VSATPADWLAACGLDPGQATILALVPNTVMDGLAAEDRERLAGLLAQVHAYRQHQGDPVADWNAHQTRAEIERLTREEGRP